MAFSQGRTSETQEFKKYFGVAPVKILAVNPTKAEKEKLFNRSFDNESEYVTLKDVNGVPVKNVLISFYVQTVDKNNYNVPLTVSFFLQKTYNVGAASGKTQIIDEYGRTAWATPEDLKNHTIPMYSSGPANISSNYRPAYVGEEALNEFIKLYLNIPNVMEYNSSTNTFKMVQNPSECIARLDNIDKLFAGDWSELREIITLQPKNTVKVMVGVRTTDDGKQYQSVYNRKFVRGSSNSFTKLFADINEAKARGAYATTEFFEGDLKEYEVTATNFAEVDSSVDDIFGSSDSVSQSNDPNDWM